MDYFRPGERVTSLIIGYHQGTPGTITGEPLRNLAGKMSYRVQLDSGKTIILQAEYIERLTQEPEPGLYYPDIEEDPEEV